MSRALAIVVIIVAVLGATASVLPDAPGHTVIAQDVTAVVSATLTATLTVTPTVPYTPEVNETPTTTPSPDFAATLAAERATGTASAGRWATTAAYATANYDLALRCLWAHATRDARETAEPCAMRVRGRAWVPLAVRRW